MALTTLGHIACIAAIYSSIFGEDLWKWKEEFVNKETQSFRYLLDMAATIKVARTRMEQL